MQSKNKQTKAVWVHRHVSYKSGRKNREVADLFHLVDYETQESGEKQEGKTPPNSVLQIRIKEKVHGRAEKTTE